jgi:hypothetical protein
MARYRQFRKSSATSSESFGNQHRFEHWYLDNQVYFITARCRDRYPAFASDSAKQVFWERFDHYTAKYTFTPWVTSLLDNHYHTLGYLKIGENLGPLMQRLHGSIAKLVNDLLSACLSGANAGTRTISTAAFAMQSSAGWPIVTH